MKITVLKMKSFKNILLSFMHKLIYDFMGNMVDDQGFWITAKKFSYSRKHLLH